MEEAGCLIRQTRRLPGNGTLVPIADAFLMRGLCHAVFEFVALAPFAFNSVRA